MSKNKNPNEIFILPNLQLMVMAIILLVLTVVPCIIMIVLTGNGTFKVVDDEYFEVQLIWGFLGAAMIAAMLCSAPKCTLSITINLENQTVTRKAWFTKTVIKHISEYKYVYEADYFHFGIRPKYIIIATEPVEEIYLTNVNNLPLSENAIAMEYSKERWDIVQRICNKV